MSNQTTPHAVDARSSISSVHRPQMIGELGGRVEHRMGRMGDAFGLYKMLHARAQWTARACRPARLNDRYMQVKVSHQAASIMWLRSTRRLCSLFPLRRHGVAKRRQPRLSCWEA